MKLLFITILVVLAVGGGLFIVFRYRDDDPRFSIGFLLLSASLGLVILLAGIYFHVTGTLLYSWKGGLVTGGQLMIAGAVLACSSLFYAIRAIRKRNITSK
jgi:hypothetical protein